MKPFKTTPEAFVLVQSSRGISVLAAWRGGYISADEWRLSTPIKRVTSINDDQVAVQTESGSIYTLDLTEHHYRMTPLTADVYAALKEQADATGKQFSTVPFENVLTILQGLF